MMKPLSGRGPRILTIDNGGLQAISVLIVLKDVCEALSKAEDSTKSLAPHELFDIIGGVGTGGWLAVLLGRYKLTIEQCMGIYTSIANALDPTRRRPPSTRTKGLPAAIDQVRLIEKVDKMLTEYGIGDTMIDEDFSAGSNMPVPSCRAFAVGVLKRPKGDPAQDYHLFRAYQAAEDYRHLGPNPKTCKVSAVCAATAAAKDFCNEYRLGETTYWDDSFPNTHNVSELALDEAATIFGKGLAPDFVLSISPGIPTQKEIDTLQRVASRNASTNFKVRYHFGSLRRALSAGGILNAVSNSPAVSTRSRSSPELNNNEFEFRRTDTSSSVCSIKMERKHQRFLKARLKQDFNDEQIYHRLELPPEGFNRKPYLNDIASPDRATELADAFLRLTDTQSIIQSLVTRSSVAFGMTVRDITERPRCQSPTIFALDARDAAVAGK